MINCKYKIFKLAIFNYLSGYRWQSNFNYLKRKLIDDKRGGATLEIVIVTAVLIAVALLFNDSIRQYAESLFRAVFNQSVISKLEY